MEIDHHKIETMVPKQFHQWLKVFGKVESERMPVRKVWDHAIDVKEDFKPSKAKVYPLSRNEREEVQKFVDEHLKKGYIQPSKSEQTSPVFFVEKKDGGKRMVMDYHKLNRQTVKNNYPLPLITELVDNMGSKRVFTWTCNGGTIMCTSKRETSRKQPSLHTQGHLNQLLCSLG